MQEWLSGCGKKLCGATFCSTEKLVLVSLYDFPERFISHQCSVHFITYDDEDLDAWAFEAKRWARVLFLLINDEHHVEPILMVCLLILFIHSFKISFLMAAMMLLVLFLSLFYHAENNLTSD